MSVFGLPLKQAVELRHRDGIKGPQVPLVVEQVVRFLESSALTTENLFRISPRVSQILALKETLGKTESVHPHITADPHVAAGLLKLYFRELPDPLLTFDLYPKFIQTQKDVRDRVSRVNIFSNLIHALPSPNREVVQYLVAFLRRIADKGDSNRMTPRDLAAVFGPNLLRPRVEKMNPIVDDAPLLEGIVETLIEQYTSIFKGNPTLHSFADPLGSWRDSLHIRLDGAEASAYDHLIDSMITNLVVSLFHQKPVDFPLNPNLHDLPVDFVQNVSGGSSDRKAEAPGRFATRPIQREVSGSSEDSETSEVSKSPPTAERITGDDSNPATSVWRDVDEVSGGSGSVLTNTTGGSSPGRSSLQQTPLSEERKKWEGPGMEYSLTGTKRVTAGKRVKSAGRNGYGSNTGAGSLENVSNFRKVNRRKLIVTCKKLGAEIRSFEKEFMIQRGRKPRESDKDQIRPKVEKYHQLKRTIRSHAATQIQSIWRGFSVRCMSATSLSTRRPVSASSQGGKGGLGRGHSQIEKTVPAGSSDALLRAGDRLRLEREQAGRPSDPQQMTLSELKSEKASIKRELKAYDVSFLQSEGREPTKADKEPMRPLYQVYNEIKSLITKAEESSQGNPMSMSGPLYSGERVNYSGSLTATVPSDGRNDGNFVKVNSGRRNVRSAESAKKRRAKSASSRPTSAIDVNKVDFNKAPKAVDYPGLKALKREIQLRLHQYEDEFQFTHGRKPKYRQDILPMEKEYEQYKLIKQQVEFLEGKRTAWKP